MKAITSSPTTAALSESHDCLIRTPRIKAPSLASGTKLELPKRNFAHFDISCSYSPSLLVYCISLSTRTRASSAPTSAPSSSSPLTAGNRHWMVIMKRPPQGVNSKPEIIDYYVKALERVLGSEKDAQMCIYDASCESHFGFCCDIDEEAARELACFPAVLSVRPDPDYHFVTKNYSSSTIQLGHSPNQQMGSAPLFPSGNNRHWLVRMDRPGVGVVTKAQMVDFYVQIMTKVLGNEKDAQMCIYHASWQLDFGFCCDLDDECARELADVPGVLSVEPDNNFDSQIKDYGGNNLKSSMELANSSDLDQTTPVKTKKLFVAGLSFYTSEKTLRTAFEGFGELVEVKVIKDKISKRSKGYAFVEYTTEEAASAALKEMNGKIINGWMIVVDVAKDNPSRRTRVRPM